MSRSPRALLRPALVLRILLATSLVACSGGGGGGGGNGEDAVADVPAGVATSFPDAVSFLYEGANPLQVGVSAGAIHPRRVAVVRGVVRDRAGAPLQGVRVSFENRPEYGFTLSREAGQWDLAFQGGEPMVLRFEKEGYLRAHRQVSAEWNALAALEEVVLVALDPRRNAVQLRAGQGLQVARGSMVRDEDGERCATALFRAGTTATLRMPDGSSRAITGLTVRATEYTVGPTGPAAMPAELPPATAYTYCVEYSVEEAEALGASSVEFDRPVVHYMENFPGFPVGARVPTGYYDRERARWLPSEDGRVIRILGEASGTVELDLEGEGEPAGAGELEELGIDEDELAELARLYEPGQSLWRVPLPHFSPWDCNFPFAPPPDAAAPRGAAKGQKSKVKDPCEFECSVVEIQTQVLGESLPIAGSLDSLQYRSDRIPGFEAGRAFEVALSGAELPGSLKRIELATSFLGQTTSASFEPEAMLSSLVRLAGTSAYGQHFQGTWLADVEIGYVYDLVYTEAAQDFEESWGRFSALEIDGGRDAAEVTLKQRWRVPASSWDMRGIGLGGWNLSGHHVYDPGARSLLMGDGRRVSTLGDESFEITTYAGGGATVADGILATEARIAPVGLAIDGDGTLYVSDAAHAVWRIDPEGRIFRVAGTPGEPGQEGTGGPALAAQLSEPVGLAVGPDGTLWIADRGNDRICHIGADGILRDIGDGQSVTDLVFGPDNYLYASLEPSGQVLQVDPETGARRVFAGVAGCSIETDGDLADRTCFGTIDGLAFGPDGSLYASSGFGLHVRRIAPDGRVSTVAGTSEYGLSGDGGPAIEALFCGTGGLSMAADGTLYIVDAGNNRLRALLPDGRALTVAGRYVGDCGELTGAFSGDGGPACEAELNTPIDVVGAPDGTLYLSDLHNLRVRRLRPALPVQGTLLVSPEADELYRFDLAGRHVETRDAFSGRTRRSFTYDDAGRLEAITDDLGTTSILRDAGGNPSGIRAPSGDVSELHLDARGFLSELRLPSGETFRMEYTADGLLVRMEDPRGSAKSFTYDSLGRLESETNPRGDTARLVRERLEGGEQVTFASADSRATTFLVEELPEGGLRRRQIAPDGTETVVAHLPGGHEQRLTPDGTLVSVTRVPHPRWGLLAPYVSELDALSASGERSHLSVRIESELADPEDPLSLVRETEHVEIDGRAFTTTRDVATGVVTTLSPGGIELAMTLDEHDRPIQTRTDPSVAADYVVYDERGQPIEAGRGSLHRRYGYDERGRLVSITDPSGATSAYVLDAAGRVARSVLPSARSFGFAHDDGGNPTQVTLPSGAVHRLEYDALGRFTRYRPPTSNGYAREYDADGRWQASRLPGGRALLARYDEAGRLVALETQEALGQLEYGPASGCCGSSGRLARSRRIPTAGEAQAIEYQHDDGRLERMAWSGAANGVFTYVHGTDQNVTRVSLDGSALDLPRDLDGLLIGHGPFALARQGPTHSVSRISGAGLTIDYQYDGLGRVASRTHSIGGTAVFSYALDYDVDGRTVARTESAPGGTHTWSFAYDADGRLVQALRDDLAVEDYAYDVDDNRILSPQGTARYEGEGRLVERAGIAYVFDADGFLAQRGSDTFVYGTRGELTSATVAGETITYAYDVMGRLTARTDASGKREFLYDDLFGLFLPAASRAPDGTLERYFWDEAGRLFALDRGGVLLAVATDHLGSPRVVTDMAGNILRTIEYDAFGGVSADSDPSLPLPIGFAGGIADPATNLVRFGWRDYEPASGRWTARDPLLFAANQASLYAYCRNSPQVYLDPTGLADCALATGAECITFNLYVPIARGKGKAALAVGGGQQVCFGADGMSVCLELGIGAGNPVSLNFLEVDPNGTLAKDGSYNELSGRVAVGPVGVGFKTRLTECELTTKTDCSVYVTVFNLCKGKAKAPGKFLLDKFNPGVFWSDMLDLLQLKLDVLAKLTGGTCKSTRW